MPAWCTRRQRKLLASLVLGILLGSRFLTGLGQTAAALTRHPWWHATAVPETAEDRLAVALGPTYDAYCLLSEHAAEATPVGLTGLPVADLKRALLLLQPLFPALRLSYWPSLQKEMLRGDWVGQIRILDFRSSSPRATRPEAALLLGERNQLRLWQVQATP